MEPRNRSLPSVPAALYPHDITYAPFRPYADRTFPLVSRCVETKVRRERAIWKINAYIDKMYVRAFHHKRLREFYNVGKIMMRLFSLKRPIYNDKCSKTHENITRFLLVE